MTRDENDPQTYAIIGAAMEVHNEKGAGFVEPVYQECLAVELGLRRIPFQREVPFNLDFKGYPINSKYRADFICYESVVIECKALEQLTDAHYSQLLNYLKASGLQRGLLLNFGAPKLEYKRIVLNYHPRPSAASADKGKRDRTMTFNPNARLTKANFAQLPPLCTDGAWGTEMQKRGATPGQMCDTWNVEASEKVLGVAQDYVDAGAQVILTNTFNSNRIVLAKHHIADRAYELSKAGAEVSKQAAKGKAYVFASIGPCGKMVMMGEIDPAEVEDAAAEQAKAFADGGADAIVIETQSDLVEAEAAAKGVLKACDLPFGFSFTFDAGENNDRTMMGVSIPEVYELAKQQGASFVGANCGAGIETFVNIAQQFAACGGDLPIWVKGNAGKATLDENGKAVYQALPQAYAEAVPQLLKAGARFIGGCCGSSPEHIKAVVAAMKEAQSVSA